MDITKIKSLIVPLMYVKTTVEQGGFTQAARYLGKTQPHISREVKGWRNFLMSLFFPGFRGE